MEILKQEDDVIYESITYLQERVILKAIEFGKDGANISPSKVGLALGYPKNRSSAPTTTALRKGIKLGYFTNEVYGVYNYTGKKYTPKFEHEEDIIL